VQQPDGPFVIQLQILQEGENTWEAEATAAELGLRPESVVLTTKVSLRARIYRADQRIEVQGGLEADCELTCDRCLDSIRRHLEAPVRMYAERRDPRDRRGAKEVREDDLGIVYHDGRLIDLTDEARQLLLLEVPWHVLCREDCKGLCPRCGVNRNEQPCACSGGTGCLEHP
jgi:uncharacterized protein